jgi:hypothetical protein
MRFVAGKKQIFDESMTASFDCDDGCLPESQSKRKDKAPHRLLKILQRGSSSKVPGIQVRVYEICTPLGEVDGLLRVELRVTFQG